jgi:hypothetical protein
MKLFLSYAEEDREVADLIAARLRADGHEIFDWMAPSQRGRRFMEEIEKGIQAAAAFIALLSPRFLRSDWCRREVEMAVQREGDLRSRDRGATFINVVHVASVRPADAGVLGGYDWLDMTSREQWATAPDQLANRFALGRRSEVSPPRDASSGGSSASPLSQPGDSVLSKRDEPTFRNRDEELHKVLHGLTSSGGPHFWLVVAPPQLGKTWLLDRIGDDEALSGASPWIVRKVDVRSEPSDVRGNPAALLTRLFGLSLPATTEPETLRGMAQAIIRSGRPHLCLLDSAELLSGETASVLRSCLSQIYNIVQNTRRIGIRLAVIVASRRDNKEWKGIIPRPGLSPLPLSEFTPDVVQQALQDLANDMEASFSQIEIRNFGQLMHRLTEGLPALLARCLSWIREEEGVDLDRLQTRELFEQLAYPYVEEELLAPESLLPPGQRQAQQPLRALVEAYRVLAPYRLFTQSHLRHHRESDGEFRVAMGATGWDMTDLWTAISVTSLLRRPLDEPWQQIHGAIRRLLYRYFYKTDEKCAEAHNEARKFVEVWTEGQIGTEQALGLVECLWHESITLDLRNRAEKRQRLIETAEKLSREIHETNAYMPPELRAFAVDRMQNDEEFQEAVGGQEIFDQLVEAVTRPEGP